MATNIYADGASGMAPSQEESLLEEMHNGPKPTEETARTRSKYLYLVEGPRGYATRGAVILRYAAYFFTIILCCALVQACFSASVPTRTAGYWLFSSSAFMYAVAVIGSWFFANKRYEIIEQVRHYVFGYMLLPATGIAVLSWLSRNVTDVGDVERDLFANLLTQGIPVLFFFTIVAVPVTWVKTVAGMRILHRSQMDDEEMLSTYNRQDGLMK